MRTFYVPDLLDGVLTLPYEEGQHCSRVLRLSPGDSVRLVDGNGGEGFGQVERSSRDAVEVRVLRKRIVRRGPGERTWLCFAPPRALDRVSWLVEKCVEVGVGRLTPFICARSERVVLREDRLLRVAVSALKQSLGVYLPRIDALMRWEDLLSTLSDYPGSRYVAHIEEGVPSGARSLLSALIADRGDGGGEGGAVDGGFSPCVLVGPEGGFTGEEVLALQRVGVEAVGLGARRLRVETAAMASCVAVSMLA